ncbi:hypothetical protein MANES_05G107751v8 [Manihot esculenta]|uniref:Uncharacterized protein n=1 Tax=Manihot esculenta TaxID=3983 RepID=A0ACB7HPV8_MANES|nr:hypothetical protein MANES_05G107751v8 [Manihot esculenta]
MELALVSSDHIEVVPTVVEGASTLGSSSNVAIVRAVVSLNRSSPVEEAGERLKRKNYPLSQGTTTTTVGTARKKRRLVKESELISSQKETSSSLPPRKPSSNKVSKGKGKESSSQGVIGDLPTSLISNESRVHFQLSLDSSPTLIAELLNNNVFEMSLNLVDPR